MSVYLDSHGHLVADSRAELHTFAVRIGMRASWFQDRPRLWHYDVMSPRLRAAALAAGAIPIEPRRTIAILAAANGESR